MADVIRIEGMEKLIERFDALLAGEKVRDAMEEACLLVERDAKSNCPVDNGTLRRSIHSEVKKESGDIVGEVGSPLQYAPYVEYGTGLFASKGDGRKTPWSYQDDAGNWHTTTGQHPQPFLIPAFNDNRSDIVALFEEVLSDG